MKISQAKLKTIIREEVEEALKEYVTDDPEAQRVLNHLSYKQRKALEQMMVLMGVEDEQFNELLKDPRKLTQFLKLLQQAAQVKTHIAETGGVASNFGGVAGALGTVAGRKGQEVDLPDHSLRAPEQIAEDDLIGILIELGTLLDEWETNEYATPESRYKAYYDDIQTLVEKYDPCAHLGQSCDEAHPGQSHEECIEVTVNDGLQEVHSDKQRRWACAQADKPASKRKDSLSKKEAEEMCTGPMK